MNLNQLYDIIVIGASVDGLSFCEQLLKKVSNIKVALVSKHFNLQTSKYSLEGIIKIEQEVIFSSFNRGLIGITLADKSTLFCKNVVIAVGTKPVKTSLKNCNIQYNLNDIKISKTTPAVVFGNDNIAAKYAIEMSKKFKYIYLCTSSFELDCESKYIKKIENIANIVHLPNCNIIGCKNDKDGNLVEVQLDTYSSIKCSTIVMSLGRLPDNSGLSKRMIDVDSNGFIKVKENNETTKVPNIFAIGDCIPVKNTRAISNVINTIISRNKFETKE